MEAKRTQISAYLHETAKKFADSVRTLPAEFKPYASQLVERTFAQLQEHFDAFLCASSWSPSPPSLGED